jgi:hypothetical protein
MDKLENITICDECMKDRIYVMEDGSGICTLCKNIVPGPIIGGMTYYEYMRLSGVDIVSPAAEEMIHKADDEARAARNEAVRKNLCEDMKKMSLSPALAPPVGLPKEALPVAPLPATPVKPQAKPVEPAVKGPGITGKLGGWLKSMTRTVGEAVGEFKNGLKDREKTVPAQAKAVLATTNPVDAPPKAGEQWSIGPCAICFGAKLGRLIQGYAVVPPPGTKYVYVRTRDGVQYYGCRLCAKRLS